jgi:hypothetical protein
MNNKGQFSIIAALLVAVVLLGSVMATYTLVRYNPIQSQSQITSAIDETNLALKHILGFTVGYYGSVMQVTGNSTYAQTLASNYLYSGLSNIADLNPQWGASFNVANLSLSANWFTNSSFSQANLNITYDLTGLGIYNIAYLASCKLSVQINPSPQYNQISLTVAKDENTPVVDLGISNFKFYLYQYSNLTWAMVNPPTEPVSSSNGTYVIDVPSGINPQSYVIQIKDSRGITVAASSFSHYTGILAFNSSFIESDHYVVTSNSAVDGKTDVGFHSDFTAQQSAPDGNFDTLSEANTGTQSQDYYPTGYSQLGSTTLVSGGLSNLTMADSISMKFRSYPSAYSSSYNTITYDSQNSITLSSSATSMQWQHTTGNGNDRLLLVSIDVFRSSATPRTITGITYDGTPLTQASTVQYSTNPQIRSYLYYLVNPSSGSKTIAVSFSGSTVAVGGSVTYSNVDQTSPVQISASNSGSGGSQSVSLTASGSNNKILFGHMGSYRTSSDYSVTEGNGQTNRLEQISSTFKGRDSDKIVTSGSVSMSWTTSQTASWTTVAAVIQPSRIITQETCEVEFSGVSNTLNWNSLLYSINSVSSVSGVDMTFQLYDYQRGQYQTSGDGYINTPLGTTPTLNEQSITMNPAQFRDSLGSWKLKFKAVMATSSSFDISIDLARYRSTYSVYSLNVEEQWTYVNYTSFRPALCIKTGTLSSEGLAVDVWTGSSWNTLSSALVSNSWNNISVSQYMYSSVFTIRLRGINSVDTIQNNWAIDSVFLRPESDQSLFLSQQNPASTVAVEVLQNGTMIWLGQNMQLTSQTIPIPPVPVKAININETIDGINQQVPFQIEDWASAYTVPLGLTNNATVFGNRQMIVFLLNTHVSDFTIWWNGSDTATQTPLACNSNYFSGDNPSAHTITNGKISLGFSTDGKFTVTSNVGTSTSKASFMKINDQASTYGAGEAYVIHNGVVRDIIQQESEWSNGVPNCPNLYSDIVLTLPANATYYTYQLNFMFMTSQQSRTITTLNPITVSSSIGQPQTENGTINGSPIVATGTQALSNSSGIWMHHWSQFTDGTNGAGIMFADQANQMLYAFDTTPPAAARGALAADSVAQTISLLPVTLSSVSFQTALDVTWYGAVVTFDTYSLPIYSASGQPGLWILAELPPTITLTVGN